MSRQLALHTGDVKELQKNSFLKVSEKEEEIKKKKEEKNSNKQQWDFKP